MEFRILFHSSTFDRFDWLRMDEDSGQVIDKGESSVDRLSELAKSADNVVCFFPQLSINMLSASFPAKASKQQLNAVAYNVEDQLAQDIEDCFFALGKQQEDFTVPVAVVSDALLDQCNSTLVENHVEARLILPQLYLCPWSDEQSLLASICQVQGGFLVRYDQHLGLFCDQNIIAKVLQLLASNHHKAKNRIDLYGEVELGIAIENIEINNLPKLDLLSQAITPQDAINLKQQHYQASNLWLAKAQKWRWPAVAAVALLLVMFSSSLLTLWQQEQKFEDLIHQQQIVLKNVRPGLQVSENPKQQMIQLLSESQAGNTQTGFVDLLHEYSRLKSGFDLIKTRRIQFQNDKLVINIESTNINLLENFKAKLKSSQFNASIDNVNISPQLTSGRLTLEGKEV